ncbi:unnamed protein product [Caenorhabditis brenneri]
MPYLAAGRATGAVLATVIKFLMRFHHIVFPLAGIVVTALEVYKFTRKSSIPLQEEVEDIVYWRDPKKSGVVIGFLFLVLHIVCKYPITSVITYTLLLILGSAVTYRLFWDVEANPRRTNRGYYKIIAKYLLPLQKIAPSSADLFFKKTVCTFNFLLKLVLLDNELNTVKFALVLIALTYILHWIVVFPFTMLVACFGASTIPKIYKANQATIDRHFASFSEHIEYLLNL